ncbi:MAG: hypothetical protein K9J13_15815 [Saprospiraceae bacterium]|nr:hypothetical protein [Saprospiraceae bacterium]
MTTVAKYKYEVNAIFVVDNLKKLGIEASVNQLQSGDTILFEVKVKDEDSYKAEIEIKKMDIDDSIVDPDSEGYLDGVKEWNNNVYNPGHYTGGNIPHYLKDKSMWKYAAPFFLLCALCFGYILIDDGFKFMDYESLIFMILLLVVGISMIWQLRKKSRNK